MFVDENVASSLLCSLLFENFVIPWFMTHMLCPYKIWDLLYILTSYERFEVTTRSFKPKTCLQRIPIKEIDAIDQKTNTLPNPKEDQNQAPYSKELNCHHRKKGMQYLIV